MFVLLEVTFILCMTKCNLHRTPPSCHQTIITLWFCMLDEIECIIKCVKGNTISLMVVLQKSIEHMMSLFHETQSNTHRIVMHLVRPSAITWYGTYLQLLVKPFE